MIPQDIVLFFREILLKDSEFLRLHNKRYYGPKGIEKILRTKYNWDMIIRVLRDYIPGDGNFNKYYFWTNTTQYLSSENFEMVRALIEAKHPKPIEVNGELYRI